MERYLQAARDTNTQVIAVTDHDLVSHPSGWHDGVFLLSGCETTLACGSHLLAFGATAAPPPGLPAPEACAHLRAQGAALFAAHPDDAPLPSRNLRAFPFTPWAEADLDGLEAWNLGTEAKRRINSPLSTILVCNHPSRALWGGPSKASTARLGLPGVPRGAIAGLDAHAIPIKVGPFKAEALHVERSFAALATYLELDVPLPADPQAATTAIVSCLRAARTWAVRASRPFDISWVAESANGPLPANGATVSLKDGHWLSSASTAEFAKWHLYRDGQPLAEAFGRHPSWPLEHPGLYRLVVEAPPGSPWALSSVLEVTP